VPDLVVKLFPTSPFRRPSSIDTAIELMMKHPAADSVRSVRLCKEHPYKMWKVKNGMLVPFVPWEKKPVEAHTFSYHLLPKTYVNNASIDVTRPATIFRKGSVTGKKILGLVMDEMESLDINMPLDFMVAEAAIRKKLVRLP
jgi:CMP-N-acetylneuraminic acid synthetase